MAYTQASSGPSSEVLKLQDEITREVNGDAQHLATAVFGKVGNMPDMTRMSDDELNARYRAAYQSGDRKWLLGEAQRDPDQFVKVARRIGVVNPEEMPPPAPPPAPAAPQAAPAALPLPPAPVAGPAPLPPTVGPAPLPVAPPGLPGQPVPAPLAIAPIPGQVA